MRINTLRKNTVILCAVLFAAAIGAGTLYARDGAKPDATESDVSPHPKVGVHHLLTKPLAGDPSQQVDIEVYTFPPGASVPWHIHPDAHEFDYELEGTLTLEVAGEPPRDLKAGEAFYLRPNLVHRGFNKSKTTPARVYVVRIKPKDEPLTELVDPPKDP